MSIVFPLPLPCIFVLIINIKRECGMHYEAAFTFTVHFYRVFKQVDHVRCVGQRHLVAGEVPFEKCIFGVFLL
jgi:hypothetical protein